MLLIKYTIMESNLRITENLAKAKHYKPIDEKNMIILKEKFDNSTLFL